MKYPNAVSEARMSGARVYEIGKAELFDPAETLKRTRLDHSPKMAFEFIAFELDQIVKGIPYSLQGHPSAEYLILSLSD
jgi:hypothetical protein